MTETLLSVATFAPCVPGVSSLSQAIILVLLRVLVSLKARETDHMLLTPLPKFCSSRRTCSCHFQSNNLETLHMPRRDAIGINSYIAGKGISVLEDLWCTEDGASRILAAAGETR